MIRRATISADGVYRYRLTRWWEDKPPLTFVMLNPSTADATVDDPTIRRCIGFAERENCGGLIVVNLYALRATNPAELVVAADPRGDNDRHLLAAVADAHIHERPVVCAWGTKGGAAVARFLAIAAGEQTPLMSLGVTKDGHPRHPLYVRADAPLVPYPAVRPKDDQPQTPAQDRSEG